MQMLYTTLSSISQSAPTRPVAKSTDHTIPLLAALAHPQPPSLFLLGAHLCIPYFLGLGEETFVVPILEGFEDG